MAGIALQEGEEPADFFSQRGFVVRAVQHRIGAADFSRERHLVIDASKRFLPAQTVAPLQAGDLCFTVGRDDDDLVHALMGAGFEEERHFIYDDGMGRALSNVLGEPLLLSCDAGMDDAFESSQLPAVAENKRSEGLTIDRTVRIEDTFAEHAYDIAPGRLPRPDDVAGELIGIDDDGTATLEHLGDGAFPGGNASGQAHEDHVLKNSMCIRSLSLIRWRDGRMD